VADAFLAYIDEAEDQGENLSVVTALLIPMHEWRIAFDELKKLRKDLETSDYLYPSGEWHARDFVTGRGYISPKENPVSKARRAELFKMILRWIAEMPSMSVVNALYPYRDSSGCLQLLDAFEALVIGINRAMQARDAYAIIISDEGHDKNYRNVVRALAEANKVERIVEDAFFKSSEHSYFIQLADFCGYALLRREAPTPIIEQYGSNQAFALLGPALVTAEIDVPNAEGIIKPGDFA
jgi:hypothetical protein